MLITDRIPKMFFRLAVISPVFNKIADGIIVNNSNLFIFRNYSTPSITGLGKGKKVKTGPVLEKKVLPVEKDTKKLVKYVCGSNIMKEGNDVELGPDSEYPDWLWTLHIGKPKTLEEMNPDTIQYWKKVRAEGMKKKNKLISLRKY